MSTAGHLVTMLGVLSFYFMIADSKIEKKLTIYLHSLVARFNKRFNYSLGKTLVSFLLNKNVVYIPTKKQIFSVISHY